MRTNIDIDDRLMRQAIGSSGARTKRAVVEEALRLLIETKGQGAIHRARQTEADDRRMRDARVATARALACPRRGARTPTRDCDEWGAGNIHPLHVAGVAYVLLSGLWLEGPLAARTGSVVKKYVRNYPMTWKRALYQTPRGFLPGHLSVSSVDAIAFCQVTASLAEVSPSSLHGGSAATVSCTATTSRTAPCSDANASLAGAA